MRVVAVLGHDHQPVLGAVGARGIELDLYGLTPLAVRRVAGVYRRAASLGHIMVAPPVHAVGILTASRRVAAHMRGAFVRKTPQSVLWTFQIRQANIKASPLLIALDVASLGAEIRGFLSVYGLISFIRLPLATIFLV